MNQADGGRGAATALRSPHMVGRDGELAQAETALLQALRGDFQVVVVTGEAGVGKTRLATEIARRAVTFGFACMFGACAEAALTLPYLPFVEAIGNHLAAEPERAAKLRRRLGALANTAARLFPILGADQPEGTATSSPLDTLRLFESVVVLLRDVAAEHGLLLVLEDLHWTDGATQELLDFVARRMRQTRAMLLVTARDTDLDHRHPLQSTLDQWRRSGQSQTIRLRPLEEPAVAAMVGAMLSIDLPPEELVHTLHQRSDGVPFAIEELLSEAVQQTHAGDGDISGADVLMRLPAPTNIADQVLARVERLGPEQLEVLRLCSVFGQSVDVDVLAHVASLEPPALIDSLDACVDAQLLVTDPAAPALFRFRHGLIRDALYESMTPARRRLRHSQVADRLSAIPNPAPNDVAYHLLAAQRPADAAPWCAQAAELALQRFAPRDACTLFERAVEGTADLRERGRLRCRLGEAFHQAGDLVAAQQHLEAGLADLERAGDTVCAAGHELSLGRCCWERSRPDLARSHYEHARGVLESEPPSPELAEAYMRLGELSAAQFDAEESQRLGQRALEVAQASGDVRSEIAARGWLGLALCDLGQRDEGVEQLLRSADAAEAERLPLLSVRALGRAASVLESYGRVSETAPILQRMRSLAADPWTEVMLPYYDGWRLFWSADLSAARLSAQRCIDLAQRFGMEAQAGWGQALMSAVLTELDQVDAAAGLVPPYDAGADLQVLLEQAWARIRNRLAAGDVPAATEAARAVCAYARQLAGTALSDTVVEALLAAGDTRAAEEVIDAVSADARAAMHPAHLLRARARLLLARGAGGAAAPLLEQAGATFERSGYRLESLRTGILAVDALAQSGDLGRAQQAADALLADPLLGDAVLLRRLAEDAVRRHELQLTAVVATQAREPEPLSEEKAAPSLQTPSERLVSVLFVDIRGYTPLSRSRAPADMADRIAMLQRYAQRTVRQRRGIVDKFAGDAVMATFNATGAHVDHTLDALEAALEILSAASALGFEMGAGIAVGPAIVGRMVEQANVSVLGEVTNLAARLQAAAGGREVLLSVDAHRRVRERMPASVLRAEECILQLKGFDEPVAAVRLTVSAGDGATAPH